MKDLLNKIVSWLNQEFNQHTDKTPPKKVYRFDENTAISFWGCGAIVCHETMISFINEDDGHWFHDDDEYSVAYQSGFSIGWAKSFAKALSDLNEYVEKHGKPVYFSGTNILCHYKL